MDKSAPRRIAAVDRRGLRRRELDGQSPDRLGRDSGDLRRPLGRLPDPIGLAREVGAIRGATRRTRWQVGLVELEAEVADR